jgi:hypothetical protein
LFIIDNPFSLLSETLSAALIQTYVILMFLLVVGGTVIDVLHKKSATYFFENAEKAKKNAKRQLSSSERRSVLVKTVTEDVLTSAEFCNPKRRMSHLLGMYGFVLFVLSTAILVFFYPTSADAGLWPLLWHLGALMVVVGGAWFWFFIRVDVSAEGQPWNRIVRADMFILSLLGTTAFGLLWSFFQSMQAQPWTTVFLILFILASTVLFGGVLWSKFAHMFFKPAAAYQKRIAKADGSLDMLPEPADRTNPADRDRHSMELLRNEPMNMGLGIKREQPQHY